MKRKLIIAIIVLITIAILGGAGFALNGYFGGGDIGPDTFTRGLMGYWSFEEGSGITASDSSDQGNNGTLTNMDSNTDWVTGKAGNGGALDFDGSNDEVDIGNPTSLQWDDDTSVSIWFKPNVTLTGSSGRKDIVTKTNAWWILYDVNAAGGGCDNGALSITIGGAGCSGVSYATELQAGQWYHIAFAFNNTTNALSLYLDGVLVASGTATNAMSTSEDMRIGSSTGGNFTHAVIDEVRVYKRTLSSAEVKMLYNRGGPVAHYKFDEGSGTTAFDSAGSNDGTLTAMEEADWVSGQFGTALDFGGTDEFVNVGDTGFTSVRTLSFWAKPQDTTEQFIELSATDSVEVSAGVVTVTGFGTETVYVDGVQTTSFPDTSWHHVVVVSSSNITANTVELGRVSTTYYVGQMDDVRIYEYARTAGEIRLDYNAGFAARFGGSPNQDVTRGLQGFWDFEEGSGDTANDRSDQGNNGTLQP